MKPKHIAIIMDGNGRWAQKNALTISGGHKKGADNAKKIAQFASKNGIEYLTLFAFSSENWGRPKEEVGALMALIRYYLSTSIEELHKNNIKIKIIGDREALDEDIVKQIIETEELTKNNQGMTLLIALSYGSRQEIVNVAKKLVAMEISSEELNQSLFNSLLYSFPCPDPDLLIRTGGEMRISNFLLWQAAYAELYFSDKLWPDFTEDDLNEAILEYSKRERRYGNR